jgi:hypothetical protein
MGITGGGIGGFFGSIGDGFRRAGDGIGNMFADRKIDPSMQANNPYFQQDRNRLGGMLDGRSAFAGQEWGGLVSQLQAQANGTGPSMAQQAYRQASQDTGAQLGSMARGSASPAAARNAMMQQGRVGQGMAQGLAQARTGEMLAGQQSLAQALSQRDQINSGAFQNILGAQLGLSEQQLRAQMANQQYHASIMGQPTEGQKWLAFGSQLGAGLAKGMG